MAKSNPYEKPIQLQGFIIPTDATDLEAQIARIVTSHREFSFKLLEVDNGIGGYEYWGSCGFDTRWEVEMERQWLDLNEEQFEILEALVEALEEERKNDPNSYGNWVPIMYTYTDDYGDTRHEFYSMSVKPLFIEGKWGVSLT